MIFPPNTEPTEQKPPCPPVPNAPSNANLDANIRASASSLQEGTRPPLSFVDGGDDPIGRLAAHALWFYNQVKPGGPWDYKQQNTYKGQHTAFGNFNYGATGLAAGFTQGQLLRMAGQVHSDPDTAGGIPAGLINRVLGRGGRAPYGDDEEDQRQIRAGFDYYNRRFVLKDCP